MRLKKTFAAVLCAGLLFLGSAIAEPCTVRGTASLENGQLLSGVPMTLLRETENGCETAAETVTDESGAFRFEVEAGSYRVASSLTGGAYAVTSFGEGTESANGCVASALLTVDETNAEAAADAVLTPAFPVTVQAYADENGDAKLGKYERGITGIVLEAAVNGIPVTSATTDRDGLCVLYVPEGGAEIRSALPDGYAVAPLGEQNDFEGENTSAAVLAKNAENGGSYMLAARRVGSIVGTVFEDINNNGIWEEGEPGVPGVAVHAVGKKKGAKADAVSGENGSYRLSGLRDDTYTVTADLPDGMLYARYSKTGGDLRSIFSGETTARDFSVKNSTTVTDKNIGVVQKGGIGGKVFLDVNYNGLMDEDEPGVAGVVLEAYRPTSSDYSGRTVSAADGTYLIENLRGGDYKVRAILPEDGTVFSVTGGTFETGNQFVQRGGRREYTVQTLSIESGGFAALQVGVATGATISGTLFEDKNYNGIKDGKEKVFSGLHVTAVNAAGEEVSEAVSDKKGAFTLKGIMPGTYTLHVQRRTGYGFTRNRSQEKGGSHVVVLENNVGVTDEITVAMGESVKDINAGMLPSATLGGKLFNDTNDDGVYNAKEGGMTAATVRLFSEDAEMDLHASVKADGSYFFDGVMPGTYVLSYELPEYCEMCAGFDLESAPFQIAMGDSLTVKDAAAVVLGSYVGTVFNDANGNGVMDAGEAPVAGAVVEVGGIKDESAADGSFAVSGMRPGDHPLRVTLPEGMIFACDTDADGLLWPIDGTAAQTVTWAQLTNRTEKQIAAVHTGTIRGVVWMDENKNAAHEAGEWQLDGLTLELCREGESESCAYTVSTSDGFVFNKVRPGTYTVRFEMPAQSQPANDSESTFTASGSAMLQRGVTVAEGETVNGLSAGLVSKTSIGGRLILSENGVESPAAGVALRVLQNGTPMGTAVSDENGTYRFDGLWPGDYTVECDTPFGMVFVRVDDPDYAGEDLFIRGTENGVGKSRTVSLKMAQHQLDCDIRFIKPGKVGDIAWLDTDENGMVDEGEPRIPGVEVRLLAGGETVYSAVTDEQGYYLINDVYPGEYTLEATAYPQLEITVQVPALRIISSCLTDGDGDLATAGTFRVESGSINTDYDLGYVLPYGETMPSEIGRKLKDRDWSGMHPTEETKRR